MSGKNVIVDGTLAWVTRLQMWAAGLRIRIISGLIGAAVFTFCLFVLRPPLPIDLSGLSNGVVWGAVDLIKWELATVGFDWLYPPLLIDIAELPDASQQAALKYLLAAKKHYWLQYLKYGVSALMGAALFYRITAFMGFREQMRRSEDQHLRGAELTSPKELSRLVEKKCAEIGDHKPRLNVGGVLIPRRNEITPWCIIGRPQQGKSTEIKDMIDQIVKLILGKRVHFDSKGDYLSTHYQSGDLIFAPSVDQRSIRWTVFNDIKNLSQVSDMVAALIPESSKDPMWATGAKLILEGLFIHCIFINKRTNAYLWHLCCLPLAEMKTILVATPGADLGASMLDKPEITTSVGFGVNLKAFLKPIQLLARMDGPFSVREWLVDGKNDGLFIVSTPDHQEVLKPLMNLFLSTLLTAHKSLPDDRERRIWYLLDELAVLPKVPGLADALNFGPSKGLCAVLGFQSYQQIDNLYGRDIREAIVSAAGTHIIFSVGSERTSEELSKLVGEAEVLENRGTLSTGITDNRHGGSTMEQITKRRLVLPDEIKDLPPLSAYLKLLGYPSALVKFKYIPYPTRAVALEPDPSFDLDLYLLELSQIKISADVLPQSDSAESGSESQQHDKSCDDSLMAEV